MRLDNQIDYIRSQLPVTKIEDWDWFNKRFELAIKEAKILEDFVESLNAINTLERRNKPLHSDELIKAIVDTKMEIKNESR